MRKVLARKQGEALEHDLVEVVEMGTTLDWTVRKGLSASVTFELRWDG